ncbi:SRPBCC family protein [Cupriavidus sp. NPDC089707]|uniref:SRPBCC family protein n=1 Tax=Cupriavidus sp. NPDC089707 TaxID=3363963 RepID=UPI003819B53B
MLRFRKPIWGLIFAALAVALLLVPLPWADRTSIHDEVVIARTPAEVFDYISTPQHWPAWYPASGAVAGATDHPLGLGERVAESFVAGERSAVVIWTVTISQRPRIWAIAGEVPGGRRAGTITYKLTPAMTPSLTPSAESTRFEREFSYQSPTLLFALINRLMLRSRLQSESAEAVRRLKARLEAPQVP